jgi:hypothetical protein
MALGTHSVHCSYALRKSSQQPYNFNGGDFQTGLFLTLLLSGRTDIAMLGSHTASGERNCWINLSRRFSVELLNSMAVLI